MADVARFTNSDDDNFAVIIQRVLECFDGSRELIIEVFDEFMKSCDLDFDDAAGKRQWVHAGTIASASQSASLERISC